MNQVAGWLEQVGLPVRDDYGIPSSSQTFPDGGHYRMEVSGVERLSTLEALVDEAQKQEVTIHRLICTVLGATLLTKKELRGFAELASQAGMEVIITPGPRPQWEAGKQISHPEGAVSGLRIRGMDNLGYLLSDIRRCLEIGFRGFLVWDEGVLTVLDQLRQMGELPKETVFKVSIFAGHANPAGALLLERLGADTFNPVADLTLPMLSAIRQVIRIPMDIHVHLFESFGGQNRIWETPEVARVAAPCYFKIEPGVSLGSLYKSWVAEDTLACAIREKVRQAKIIEEIVGCTNPDLRMSPPVKSNVVLG